MIISFKDKATKKVFKGYFSKKLPSDIQKIALRKLMYLQNATSIKDLSSPPGNHLERLNNYFDGDYSIRINNQWRVCFDYNGNDEFANVKITDYH